jgi:hypothetical protein
VYRKVHVWDSQARVERRGASVKKKNLLLKGRAKGTEGPPYVDFSDGSNQVNLDNPLILLAL